MIGTIAFSIMGIYRSMIGTIAFSIVGFVVVRWFPYSGNLN